MWVFNANNWDMAKKAQKDGEVAEPSGGGNGDPHRLAEVYC